MRRICRGLRFDPSPVSASDLLLAHAAATWAMVGLIWMVQLVQYPGFARVGRAEFARYHEHHCRSITWIVGPLMGAELATGVALWLSPPAGASGAWLALGLVPIALNAALTGLAAMPLHGRLGAGDAARLRALLAVNAARALLWTWRGVWVLLTLRSAAS